MNACQQCGTVILPADNFCNACGAQIPRAVSASAPPPPKGNSVPPAPSRCQVGHEIAPGGSYCPHGHPIAIDAIQFANDAYGNAAFAATEFAAGASPSDLPPPPPAPPMAPQFGGHQGHFHPAQPYASPAPLPPQHAHFQPAERPAHFPSTAPPPAPLPSQFGYQGGASAVHVSHPPLHAAAVHRPLRGFLVSFQLSPAGDFWPLYAGRVTLGRANSNEQVDIPLADATISSRHAVLHVDSASGAVQVEDSGSTNGTYINEEHIGFNGRRELRDGDRIRLGAFVAVVKLLGRV